MCRVHSGAEEESGHAGRLAVLSKPFYGVRGEYDGMASGFWQKGRKRDEPGHFKAAAGYGIGAFLPGLEPSEGGGFGMFRKYWKMIEKK